MQENPPIDDYLFATEHGNRLVRYDGGKAKKTPVDSVKQCWDKVLVAAGAERDGTGTMRWLSFKYIRKTSATAIDVLAGGGPVGAFYKELSLAHAQDSVAAKHYTGTDSADQDFAKLAEYVQRLRTETFAKMFEHAHEEAVRSLLESAGRSFTTE